MADVATVTDTPVAAEAAGTPAASVSSDERSRAVEFVNRPQFSRRLTLPATDAHSELTVTYAVGGSQDASAPTILFMGGMMGGRYLATIGDYLGNRMGLRLVVVDRPGLGGSTDVDVKQRIQVWLETVPVLLRELGAQHVTLAAHSCGVIYALNTVHAMPEILGPSREHPALYLFSPWVVPEHSGAKLMATVSRLPAALVGRYDLVVSLIGRVIAPSLAFSSTVFASAATSLGLGQGGGASSTSGEDPEAEADGDADNTSSKKKPKPRHQRDGPCREAMGISAKEWAARSEEIVRRIWREDVRGVNGEALLSMRKPVAGSWGFFDDYAAYPGKLNQRLRQHFGQNSDANQGDGPPPRLSVRVFWAETDKMVGKGGEEYFDGCFKDFAGESTASGERWLVYESETVPETDHESLCLPQYGALVTMLEEVAAKSAAARTEGS